jgi:hypothetical protein
MAEATKIVVVLLQSIRDMKTPMTIMIKLERFCSF